MKHFFVSYNSADRQWAEWIGWQLEEAGYAWEMHYPLVGLGSFSIGDGEDPRTPSIDPPITYLR